MALRRVCVEFVVSTYVMWATDVSAAYIDLRFWLGLLIIIVGGYLVLANKPAARAV